MEITDAIILVIAGMAAGVINTFAGSGSLITLPLLMFMGLPPAVANGTNRIGVVVQNLVATRNFIHQKELTPRKEWSLIIPTLFGSLAGALIAVEINEDVLNYFIGGLLVVMFFIILLKPTNWIKGKAGQVKTTKSRIINIIIFFLIGLYGGFIQAGVGLFLIVFISAGQVVWSYGLLLAAGNAIGAWFASKNASKIGAQNIRYILLAVVLISGLKVLGVF
jgi:hypothetical protein